MKSPLCLLAASLSFSALFSLQSETVTLLESFEDNVDNLAHETEDQAENRRVVGFSQTADNDLGQVTHGEKALKVEFSRMNGWQRDFRVILDKAATEVLQEVVNTDEVGRYYLAYDITFETGASGANWANNPMELGGWLFGDQIEWGGGDQVVTMAYELAAGTPDGFNMGLVGENGDQTFIGFIFNSDATAPMNVYVDHIRLIDTKLPGAEPSVTLLNSFEDDIGAVAVQGRAEGPETNEDPAFVSQGSKSVKLALTGSGSYAQDFTVDLNSNKLAEVLEMPQQERMRYTLAYDWFAAYAAGTTAGWFQQIVGPWSPQLQLTQSWAGDGGMRTRAINLGLINWDTPPVIALTHNSNWSGGDMLIYVDNVRLIDYGYVPSIFSLENVSHGPDGFSFSWDSAPGKVYEILRTDSLGGEWLKVGEITASGDTGSYVDSAAGKDRGFFQVANVPAPPIFQDDFESASPGWTTHVLASAGSTTQWERGTPTAGQVPGGAHSGQNVYGTDLDKDYEFNTQIALRSPVLDLSGLQAATLLFWAYQDVEPLFEGAFVDFVEIHILDANGNDLIGNPIRRRSGINAEWSLERVRIPAEAVGQSIRVEFRFTSDAFNMQDPATGAEVTQAGWFIDDVQVVPE